MKKKRILLSFVGAHDPYGESLVEGARQNGPILQMLRCRPFDGVILFITPKMVDRTRQTVEAIENAWSSMHIETKNLNRLDDPTDHIEILKYLRRFVLEIISAHPESEFAVSISSGTPSMHACWLLLAAEGSLPARLLYGHPKHIVGSDDKISEVDLESPEFPNVAPIGVIAPAQDQDYVPDIDAIREELQIIGDDPVFVTVLERVGRLARYGASVLLLGETGTGKDKLAEFYHRVSGRSGRFVPINCASIPGTLAESALFGHVKGAYTGASQDCDGVFVNADGGTLFLDEIGEMPADIQAKLLRVLQDGMIKPVGARDSRKVDVCVIAATNADLAAAIRGERFRNDLAQRFADTVELPPLRQRRGDILNLATRTLNEHNIKHGHKIKMSRDALAALQDYAWPGNVRELVVAVQRAAMLCRDAIIRGDDLRLGEARWNTDASATAGVPEPHEGFDLHKYLDDQRDALYQRALDIAGGNQAKAARLLNVKPQAVHKHLKRPEDPGQ